MVASKLRLGKRWVHGLQHAQRVGGAVEKIRVAEGDVLRACHHLLFDVGQHYVHLDRAELALIHRHHRAMPAQVLAAARGLGKADNFFAAVGQVEVGVAGEFGQSAAIRWQKCLLARAAPSACFAR